MGHAWKTSLAEWLRTVRRLVILGVGNEMKGDDAAGLLCAAEINRRLKPLELSDVKIIISHDVPENFTGEIRKFQPSHVLLIDSAVAPGPPGSVLIIDKALISDEESSTHRIPLLALISYVEQTMGASVAILGIRPKSLEFGATVSAPVRKAVDRVSRHISRLLSAPHS